MPLEHGKSKKSFVHNLKAEMDEGKPMKQSLAIAYAVKRRAGKKMAKGGMLTQDGYESQCNEHCVSPCEIHPQASGYMGHEGDDVKHNEMAMDQDDKMLNQHGEDEIGPEGRHMAKGGNVDLMPSHKKYAMEDEPTELAHGGHVDKKYYSNPEHAGLEQKGVHSQYSSRGVANAARSSAPSENFKESHRRKLEELRSMPAPKLKGLAMGGYAEDGEDIDMVGRVMKKRQHMYAKGGVVANDVHQFEDEFDPNEFDDMVLDDHLDGKQVGSNEHGDEYDSDHSDPIAKIMMKRRKQHNPNPA